jgi:pre-mRNA cleavage complex 2 protein Pcf11
MIAEDYKDAVGSATKLYHILRQRLLSCKASEKLPVLYVLDSVLKNCKGCYIEIVEQDAASWMAVVYNQLDANGQQKLQKVWRTWNEFQLFSSVSNWKHMGRCFTEINAAVALSSTQFPAVAGISRTVRAF